MDESDAELVSTSHSYSHPPPPNPSLIHTHLTDKEWVEMWIPLRLVHCRIHPWVRMGVGGLCGVLLGVAQVIDAQVITV